MKRRAACRAAFIIPRKRDKKPGGKIRPPGFLLERFVQEPQAFTVRLLNISVR
jgi:hypothetical protein